MIRQDGTKEIILYIDTTNNKEIIVSLRIDGELDEIRQIVGIRRAQVIVPLIDDLLQKHSLTIHAITKIEVNEGPGSFTGIRVGITIANTLGTLLAIPINNNSLGTLAKPIYD